MLIALAIILLLLILLTILRIGVTAQYNEQGPTVLAHIGPFFLKLYPKRKKTIKHKSKEIKDQLVEEKKGGTVEQLKELMPLICESLSRLKRKLTVNHLTIYYLSAGSDPAKTAMNFGLASAGLGFLTAVLENNFKIKKRDVRTNLSFTEEKSSVYIRLKMSLAIWEIVYIGWGIIIQMGKNAVTNTKNRRVELNHGKTSNQRSHGDNNAEDPGDG